MSPKISNTITCQCSQGARLGLKRMRFLKSLEAANSLIFDLLPWSLPLLFSQQAEHPPCPLHDLPSKAPKAQYTPRRPAVSLQRAAQKPGACQVPVTQGPRPVAHHLPLPVLVPRPTCWHRKRPRCRGAMMPVRAEKRTADDMDPGRWPA